MGIFSIEQAQLVPVFRSKNCLPDHQNSRYQAVKNCGAGWTRTFLCKTLKYSILQAI
jgi:hypothetical protein